MTHLSLWTESEIASHLIELGISENLAVKFKEHKITGKLLLDENQWSCELLKEELGIQPFGERKEIEKVINNLIKAHEISLKEREKEFQDSVHSTITLHPLLVKIMDTPQFQRLRDIKQLGTVYYVYPGASHNRFEHSIGVCYLAGEFIQTLRNSQPELNISDREVLCVQLAALCHDLGHGPFSHLFENRFVPSLCKDHASQWNSKIVSFMMLEYMIEANELRNDLSKYGIDWDVEQVFIKELIVGVSDLQKASCPPAKHFLYEIVSNNLNGVDVDKMDYIARDGQSLGVKRAFEWRRYMKNCRVIKVDNSTHICPRKKEEQSLKDLFESRNHFFRIAYCHKTKLIIEKMICDALMLVDDHFLIEGHEGKFKKMSDAIKDKDMCLFTKLTDSILNAILYYPTNDQNKAAFEKAKQIIQNIQSRAFSYELIESTKNEPQHNEKETEDEGFADESEQTEIVTFDYGFGEEYPLDKIWFQDSKERPNEAVKLKIVEV